jgi:hypothetical protein
MVKNYNKTKTFDICSIKQTDKGFHGKKFSFLSKYFWYYFLIFFSLFVLPFKKIVLIQHCIELNKSFEYNTGLKL